MVYPFAPWESICSLFHSFRFSWCLPWRWHFMGDSAGVSIRGRLLYRCTWSKLPVVLVEFGLVIYFCFFECVIFVISCSSLYVYFPCLFFLLITIQILVPLITISRTGMIFKTNLTSNYFLDDMFQS